MVLWFIVSKLCGRPINACSLQDQKMLLHFPTCQIDNDLFLIVWWLDVIWILWFWNFDNAFSSSDLWLNVLHFKVLSYDWIHNDLFIYFLTHIFNKLFFLYTKSCLSIISLCVLRLCKRQLFIFRRTQLQSWILWHCMG